MVLSKIIWFKSPKNTYWKIHSDYCLRDSICKFSITVDCTTWVNNHWYIRIIKSFLVSNAPWMLLVSDIRTGLVYFLLFGFWVVFISEHLLERPNRNKMVSQWQVIAWRFYIFLVKLQDWNVSYYYLYLFHVHLRLCGTRYPNSLPVLVYSWFYSRSTVSYFTVLKPSVVFHSDWLLLCR